jgi:hypothetical protein
MRSATSSDSEFLKEVRDSRLSSYQSTPQDINAHYSDEGQIQADYHKRFAFELIQNADDAMADVDGQKRVLFELDGNTLLVANTGRPIDEDDVEALCTMSYTTKDASEDDEEAPIGHKGRGFSSVLDLTDSPQVYSTGISFEFDRSRASDPIYEVVDSAEDWTRTDINGIPLMRLPFPPKETPERVEELLDDGFNTVFRFELKSNDLREDALSSISDLDEHTAVFLQNLEELELSLDGSTEEWGIQRKTKEADNLQSSLEFVTVEHKEDESETDRSTFALFSRQRIPIDGNTGGIDTNTWGEVDTTRVGLALRVTHKSGEIHLESLEERPFLHVFLPTEERCPIPALVNGAFYTKISRTSVDVTADENNYNALLLEQVADLIASDVLSYAERTATSPAQVLGWLDFTHLTEEARESDDTLEGRFVSALRSSFADVPFLPKFSPSGESADSVSLREVVIPYHSETRPRIAEYIARIHGDEYLDVPGVEATGYFPDISLLSNENAGVLSSLNATVLSATDVPAVLGEVDDDRSPLNKYPDPDDELAVDPILQVLIWVYETISDRDEILDEFKSACRGASVFPVGRPSERGIVRHVAKTGQDTREFFFPPQNDIPDVNLPEIEFLSPPLYRPELGVDSRRQSELVADLKPALESIWDVKEFEFEQVTREAIFPVLQSPRQLEADDTPLRNYGVLELVWRLASESVTPDSPLPHIERTQTLHQLCLLPVPTRSGGWRPACRVYFGEDWQPDASKAKQIEPLLDATGIKEAHYLAPPETFPEVGQGDADGDVTDLGEETRFDEWRDFFRWLGVSPHVRVTPLFDPQTRRDLMSTKGIERSNNPSALDALDEPLWEEYKEHLTNSLDESAGERGEYDSIYRMQSLEFLDQFIRAVQRDEEDGETAPDSSLGTRLLEHITQWWPESLQEYHHPTLATHDVSSFSRRNQNCPKEREKRRVGLNLWLWQLKHARWCPTGHGVRQPDEVWMPTESVRSRFQLTDGYLLPVLQSSVAERTHESAGFYIAVGVRRDLSQSTFQPRDARIVIDTLANTFTDETGGLSSESEVTNSIRQIKSAYRYISELLPALADQQRTIRDETWRTAQSELADSRILCRRDEDEFVFTRASEAYFVDAPDVLEQIPIGGLPVFVLREPEAVRFGVHFDIRDLESVTTATPRFIDERTDLRDRLLDELEQAAPYILCRLEAERQSQELITRDLSGMRSFLNDLDVVDAIEVDYELTHDDETLTVTSEPPYYLDRRDRSRGEPAIPIVRAAENSDEQYRYLARAICGALDVTQFEGVVTMLTATDDSQRRDYLRLAGAPSSRNEIESKRRGLHEDADSDGGVSPTPNEPSPQEPDYGAENTADPATESIEERTPRRQERPVYSPAELAIGGDRETIIVEPDPESDEVGGEDSDTGDGGGGSGAGGNTSQEYRSAIDSLGMKITMRYEQARLRDPELGFDFEALGNSPADYVFAVDTEQNIEDARDDPIAGPAIETLNEDIGLPLPYPGFDILTVNPDTGEADRLIELKSSGNDTRTPGITWNEWKTARTSEVSDRFYLYIVGNLRKDIRAEPYIREIPNPFELLRAETEERTETTREVKVNVTNFRKRGRIHETQLTNVEETD